MNKRRTIFLLWAFAAAVWLGLAHTAAHYFGKNFAHAIEIPSSNSYEFRKICGSALRKDSIMFLEDNACEYKQVFDNDITPERLEEEIREARLKF